MISSVNAWLEGNNRFFDTNRKDQSFNLFFSYNNVINPKNYVSIPEAGHKYDLTSNSHYAVTSTLLTILIIITLTLLLVILWINRITVREKFSPLIENFKTSLQYSTLEKQEETPEVHV